MAKKDKKVKDFLEHLNTVPNISLACEKVGLARNTIYRWCKEDKEFQESVDNALLCGVDSITDLAESKLITHINNGNLRSIQYWLDNHKKEYIRPRVIVDSKDSLEPISYIEILPVDPNNLPPPLPLNEFDLPLDYIG
jgi:hypothetical protein